MDKSKFNLTMASLAMVFAFSCSDDDGGEATAGDASPLSRILWTKASPPGGIASDLSTYIEHLDFKHAGEFVWHSNTTLQNRQIFQVIGNSDVDNRKITIMSLKLKPNDNLNGKSWGGIMRANSSFYQDLSQKKYIEMVVRGNVGSLYVDLGAISEDISINGYEPNGSLNSESISNNSTTPKHDYGLSYDAGVYETLQVWNCRYAECKSTILNNGSVALDRNTDIDKFDPNYLDMDDPPPQINGTRGNAGERSYDTEDINRNGQLDLDINFARYRIDLSTTDKLEFEELQNGWRRFKIPIDQFDTIVSGMGSSLMDILSEATFTRLWYGSLGTGVGEGRAQIADFKIEP